VPQIDTSVANPDFERMSHRENLISPQTLLFSRSVLDQIGGFDELLVNSVDWDFSLRLVANAKVLFIEEPLVMTYIQDDSISRLKRSQARSQLRILLKLRRRGNVDPKVLGAHFSRVGMVLTRLRKPKMGRRLLRQSVGLAPTVPMNWVKLLANIGAGKFLGRA
jgi:GT2 family glycosyltransferase